MSDSVIVASDLRRRYGDFEAVRGVSFEVRRGELFALLGTNGAGKTTTLETLEGHRPPSGGSVSVLGMDPYRQRQSVRRHTGIMLQESGTLGELTVAETVDFWASLRNAPSDRKAAIEALDLGGRRDVRVKQLSGGERRRLDFAAAILGPPEILFLDEPTTGLDPQSRRRSWEIVRDLLRRGSTVLLTTHYLEEAEQLADRIAIMHEGRIAVAGDLASILAGYPALIAFDLPDGRRVADLPAIAGKVDPTRAQAGRIEIRTDRLQQDLAAILSWAERENQRLGRLRAQHASLEDVFQTVSGNETSFGPGRPG